jgi:hypothetical protein
MAAIDLGIRPAVLVNDHGVLADRSGRAGSMTAAMSPAGLRLRFRSNLAYVDKSAGDRDKRPRGTLPD